MSKNKSEKMNEAFEKARKKGISKAYTHIPEGIIAKCLELGNGNRGNTIKYLHFKYGYDAWSIYVNLRGLTEIFTMKKSAYVHNYINDADSSWDTVEAHAKADQKRIQKEIRDAQKAEDKNGTPQ